MLALQGFTQRAAGQLLNKFWNRSFNFSYFPIIFQTEAIFKKSMEILENNEFGIRRYFFLILNALGHDLSYCPIVGEISKRILSLSLYFTLKHEEQRMIAILPLRVQNNPEL